MDHTSAMFGRSHGMLIAVGSEGRDERYLVGGMVGWGWKGDLDLLL